MLARGAGVRSIAVANEANAYQEVLKTLKSTGVLLLSDKLLPSVTTIVAGEPVTGSWWSHPRSHQIYAVASRLGDSGDVTTVKLVLGKVTFVHRRLWPALFVAARSRGAWQCEGLSPKAESLLAAVDHEGRLRMDEWSATQPDAAAWRRAAGELEERLLVHGFELHTERGAHTKALESWENWKKHSRMDGTMPDEGEARRSLENAADELSRGTGRRARLPWQ